MAKMPNIGLYFIIVTTPIVILIKENKILNAININLK